MSDDLRQFLPGIPPELRNAIRDDAFDDADVSNLEFTLHNNAVLHLYVNNSTGDDNNSGLAENTPKQTWAGIKTLIPYIVLNRIEIHFANTGIPYDFDGVPSRLYQANLWLIGEDETVLLSNTSALSSSSTSVIKTSGLTIDQYRGKFIHILTGNAAGDYRQISTNSATDIVPTSQFSTTIESGDLYEILEPGVVFTVASGSILHGNKNGDTPWLGNSTTSFPSALYLRSIRFDAVSSTFVATMGTIGFYRCDTTANIILAVFGGLLMAGCDNSFAGPAAGAPFNDGFAASATKWRGAGISTTHTSGFSVWSGGFIGFVTAARLGVLNGSIANLTGGNIWGDTTSVSPLKATDSILRVGASSGGPMPVLVTNGATGSAPAGIEATGHNTMITLVRCTITSTANQLAAALATDLGRIVVTVGSAVVGTGAPYGLYARRGSRITVSGQPSQWVGTTEDVAAGETPNEAADTVFNVAGVALVADTPADGSVVQRI